jgi:hypothetical protein
MFNRKSLHKTIFSEFDDNNNMCDTSILISVFSEFDDNNNKCDTSVHRSIQPTSSSYKAYISAFDNLLAFFIHR